MIERSRMLQIGRVKKRFSELREQSKKSADGKSQDSLIKELDASEKKSIGEILREPEAKIKQFDTHSKELLESTTNKWKQKPGAGPLTLPASLVIISPAVAGGRIN